MQYVQYLCLNANLRKRKTSHYEQSLWSETPRRLWMVADLVEYWYHVHWLIVGWNPGRVKLPSVCLPFWEIRESEGCSF